MTDSRADEVLRRFDQLASGRSTWEAHWQEIAERVLPRQAAFLGSRPAGEKRTEKIFDSTAAQALERFAAAIEHMLTPRAQRWHGLRATDKALNDREEVRAWFEEATRVLFAMRYGDQANFASQQAESYMSLGAFGTGILFVGDQPGRGLRYKSVHLAECYVAENADGAIDTNFRKYRFTARQAAQRWGTANLPQGILRALEVEPERSFEFLHAVFPRAEWMPERAGAQAMAFASLHVALEGRAVILESGFEEFPYAISRYVTAPNEVYGRAPAMTALPDIKMLNEMSRTSLRAAHKAVDPPILVHDDGVLGARPDMRPNAINYGAVDGQGRALYQPFNSGGRLNLSLEMMEQRRRAIDGAFLGDLFRSLIEHPNMSATQVLELARGRGALLSPVMGRQQSEALGPMIARELSVLARGGWLPQMPEALAEAGGAYAVTYSGPLSQAQRAEEGANALRAVEMILPLARFDPAVMDNVDLDALARLTLEVHGLERLRRADAEIAARRGVPDKITLGQPGV